MDKTEEMQLMDKLHKFTREGNLVRALGDKHGWRVTLVVRGKRGAFDDKIVGTAQSDNLITALVLAMDEAVNDAAQQADKAPGWAL